MFEFGSSIDSRIDMCPAAAPSASPAHEILDRLTGVGFGYLRFRPHGTAVS